MKKGNILLLTIVHPDFLPPVYAVAQTLRDEGYDIHILTFDSYVKTDAVLGENISVETLGNHHNVSFIKRLRLRRKLILRAKEIVKGQTAAVITFCPLSFLYGLKIKSNFPVIYHALEMSDFILGNFSRSPLSSLNNLRALNNVHKADLVVTPTLQRSAWLAGRCKMNTLPVTVINSAYITDNSEHSSFEKVAHLLPQHFSDKTIILYTGAVIDRYCGIELVAAFCEINDPQTVLVMTGIKANAYCDEIRSIVTKTNKTDVVKLLPFVTREEMLSLQHISHIGICMTRAWEHSLETFLVAPNKVGEYIAKGLFIVANHSDFLAPLEDKGIAVLASSRETVDIKKAFVQAVKEVTNSDKRKQVLEFAKKTYCMQQQLKPVIQFLEKKNTKVH